MKEKIAEILSGLRPENDFTESSNFIEEGLLDSFDIVNLVSELEDAFSVTIDGLEIVPDNFSSIEKIENLVSRSEKSA